MCPLCVMSSKCLFGKQRGIEESSFRFTKKAIKAAALLSLEDGMDRIMMRGLKKMLDIEVVPLRYKLTRIPQGRRGFKYEGSSQEV